MIDIRTAWYGFETEFRAMWPEPVEPKPPLDREAVLELRNRVLVCAGRLDTALEAGDTSAISSELADIALELASRETD